MEVAISRDRLIADVAPWSEGLNAYDDAQFTLYLRLLDAAAAKATDAEMCVVLLGIDPQLEPVRAKRCLRSHLDRARWLLRGKGFRYLVGRETSPLLVSAPAGHH